MLVQQIKLKDYRNYDDRIFNFEDKLNLIIGNNGIGKTNILEAIIVCANSKSFRTLKDQDLIKYDKDYAKIELLSDKNNYKVVINKKNKTLFINDILIKKTSEFIGKFNAVLFKPLDLELFDQSPKERRRLLDLELGKISKEYLNSLLKYNTLLKEKNHLLKEEKINYDLLEIIENKMIPELETIILERENFFKYINDHISNIYDDITNTDTKINIIYKKCSEIDKIKENLLNSKDKDYYYRYTIFGSHHEDYYFKMNDKDLTSYASQGQRRLVLISFKLALIKYIEYKTNIKPVILLDDILSDLDDINIKRLLEYLPEDYQIIITSTNDRKINRKYQLIELKEENYVSNTH